MKNIVFVIILLMTIIGCRTEPNENGVMHFIVKVDSLAHATAFAINDTIKIKLYGTVGPDGCHAFSHFEDTTQPLQLDLTVWGASSSSTACPMVMVYLDGKEYKTLASQSGLYRINIHQPVGNVLRDSLIVN
jgi:hypothetical protein